MQPDVDAKVAAPVAAAMPASLEQLLSVATTSLPPSLPSPAGTSTAAAVVPTAQLLRLIEELNRRYRDILLAIQQSMESKKSKGPEQPPDHLQGRSSSSHGGDVADIVRNLDQFEDCCAVVQRGIRSKLPQASHLALIYHLRQEVVEREKAVAKMEGVLQVARQHVR